ncbi:MAG TPA: hypothetical protein VHT52_23935 [Stellaceae bacterium]|nr:hypothetical protein [Stellaceae bacterium]
MSDQPRYLASLAVSLKGIESVLKTRAEAEQQARMAQPSTMGEKYMSGRWLRRDGNIYTAAYIEPAVEAYKARVRRQFPRRK